MPSALAITVSAVCLTAPCSAIHGGVERCGVHSLLCADASGHALRPGGSEGALLIMLGVMSTLVLHVAVRRGGAKTWVAYAMIVALIPRATSLPRTSYCLTFYSRCRRNARNAGASALLPGWRYSPQGNARRCWTCMWLRPLFAGSLPMLIRFREPEDSGHVRRYCSGLRCHDLLPKAHEGIFLGPGLGHCRCRYGSYRTFKTYFCSVTGSTPYHFRFDLCSRRSCAFGTSLVLTLLSWQRCHYKWILTIVRLTDMAKTSGLFSPT